MHQLSINAVRSEALFVSALQRSEVPSVDQVREAIAEAVRALGGRGCAARVAQEFGDHPEVAVVRMRWAREVVEATFGHPHGAPVQIALLSPAHAHAPRAA
jgi:hypothetical protein